MSQANLTLKISFESLVDTISNLSIEDKQKLWEILDHQLHPSYSEQEIKSAIISSSRELLNQLNPDYPIYQAAKTVHFGDFSLSQQDALKQILAERTEDQLIKYQF